MHKGHDAPKNNLTDFHNKSLTRQILVDSTKKLRLENTPHRQNSHRLNDKQPVTK